MAEKFKVGTTVRLKSGGPLMTVNGYHRIAPGASSSTVVCKWFEGTASQTDKFDEEALKESSAPSEPQ